MKNRKALIKSEIQVMNILWDMPEGGSVYDILEHYDDSYVRALVDDNLRAFIRRSLKQYDVDRYTVGVVGGFGNALKDVFSRIAEQEGIMLSRFISSPIDELIKYHTV